ncbi:unnamed protein product [Rotaria sordida]|uniref:Uncharacterized protein n=1 Tax=Rotaria sordida TaxID=392033 RepID=A0A814BL43_9BILA|nr:unnamed protein product [Rotaria sordida]CAF4123949.1 unnamed protein product [Rotaria sordida]
MMSEETILLEALSSSDFKTSIHDKKKIDAKETKTAIETKQQLGEIINPDVLENKNDNNESLLSLVKRMSTEQRKKVIESLKQNGLSNPLTKEKIIQNAFTVEKVIRDNV